MGIVSWIVFGLIVGAFAKLLLPGDNPSGWLATLMVGIAGAIFGGFMGNFLGFGDMNTFDFRTLLVAIGGSMVLLYGLRLMKHSI